MQITALNPLAFPPDVETDSLARRLAKLCDKKILIIRAWHSGSELDDFLVYAGKYLEDAHGAQIKIVTKPSPVMEPEPDFWNQIRREADAFVFGAAQSCSTTTWVLQWSAALEKSGLPGVAVVFDTFRAQCLAQIGQLGLPLRWVAVPYGPGPNQPEQWGQPARELAEALTAPGGPGEKTSERSLPPTEAEENLSGSADELQEAFYRRGWTDGLPIVLPDESRVAAMLRGTSLAPGHEVSPSVPPRGWRATVEKVAINGLMAGCRPEQMPLLLACVDAFSKGNFSSSVVSTNSFSYLQLVNGPIAQETGMNPGTHALSPGNRANATLGRALGLFIRNLGGGRPGTDLMGTQGNASAYAFCVAENEAQSPWPSFARSEGYGEGESTLTIFAGGWSHVGNYCHSGGLEQGLDRLARAAARFEWPNGLVVFLSPARAQALDRLGLDKAAVQERIWQKAQLPLGAFRQDHFYHKFIAPLWAGGTLYGQRDLWPPEYATAPDQQRVPVYPRGRVKVVVVGSEANQAMQAWKMANPSMISVDKWR